MEFYPGSSLKNALDMPSVAFFALLEEGYRKYYRHMRILANVASVPHMEKSDRLEFTRQLDNASRDPRDIFDTDGIDDYSGIETLRQLMG